MNLKGVAAAFLLLSGLVSGAQHFDLVDRTEVFHTGLSQTLNIPIRIKNTSDKAQFYVVRLTDTELCGTQKGVFCLDKNCLESGTTEFTKRIEAGATLEGLHYALETGLVAGQYNVKFEIFAKGNIQGSIHHSVNVMVEEKRSKSLVFQSRDITIHEVYPNPVVDQAFIDYKLHSEGVKAKLIVHNILGSSMANVDLNFGETKAKIQADEFTPGVYFYTVYLDDVGVLTRKLIVRR